MTIISKIISKVKRWRRNNESDGNNDTTSLASAGSNNNAVADEATVEKADWKIIDLSVDRVFVLLGLLPDTSKPD